MPIVSGREPRPQEPRGTILFDEHSGVVSFDRDGTGLVSDKVAVVLPDSETLRRGDRLVLYTDGLVESPDEALDEAIVDLFNRRTAADDLEALCDSLLDGRPAAGRDDAAILAVAIR